MDINSEYKNIIYCIDVLLSCKNSLHKISDIAYDKMLYDVYNWASSYTKNVSKKIVNANKSFFSKYLCSKLCNKWEERVMYVLDNLYYNLRMKNDNANNNISVQVLWLDDFRDFGSPEYKQLKINILKKYGPHTILKNIHVKNYDEFVDKANELKKYCAFKDVVISFDHDLGCDENGNILKSGEDCLKYLINLCIINDIKLPICYVHTSNPPAKALMESLINSYFYKFLKLI